MFSFPTTIFTEIVLWDLKHPVTFYRKYNSTVTISLKSEGAIPWYDNGCCFSLPSPLFVTSCVTRKISCTTMHLARKQSCYCFALRAEVINVNAKWRTVAPWRALDHVLLTPCSDFVWIIPAVISLFQFFLLLSYCQLHKYTLNCTRRVNGKKPLCTSTSLHEICSFVLQHP